MARRTSGRHTFTQGLNLVPLSAFDEGSRPDMERLNYIKADQLLVVREISASKAKELREAEELKELERLTAPEPAGEPEGDRSEGGQE